MQRVAKPVALVVLQDSPATLPVVSILASAGLRVELTTDFQEAKRRVAARGRVVVVTEPRLGADNGLPLAAIARESTPPIPVIVVAEVPDEGLRDDAEHL